MADRTARDERRAARDGDRTGPHGDSRAGGGKDTEPSVRRDGGRRIATVVAHARRDLQELLGRPIERVSSAVPHDDGWRLSVDVVELERIPDSTSVLGSYDVVLDDEGGIVEYERVRRYYRNRADEELS